LKFDLNIRTIRTAICLIAIFLAGGDALKDYRDYRQAGSSPIPMSISEATGVYAATPFIRKWVSLTEPLELDCAQALEQTDDGKVTSTVILAFDHEKQHAFLLDYEEEFKGCDDASIRPLIGMLDEPLTKFWTTGAKLFPRLRIRSCTSEWAGIQTSFCVEPRWKAGSRWFALSSSS
jgi:hypothetical protein